jgi:hypothetical protein
MKRMNSFAFIVLLSLVGCQEGANSPADSATGEGGSMARFAISGEYLYTLSGENLRLFDIHNTYMPAEVKSLPIGSGVETLFPYGNFLFFGTTTGMLIFDKTDPTSPKFISRYDHITSCDPVVVEDTLAYVTLRTGTNCWRSSNRLEIISLSTITAPKMIAEYPMFNPHGLGIDNGTLFICDGDAGLKIYDATDPLDLVLKKTYASINAYDVIPEKKLLIMTGEDGIYQYDYSNIDSVKFVSKLEVAK